MQEQNLEEWKEKIDRSAEQITVPDTLTPGACLLYTSPSPRD